MFGKGDHAVIFSFLYIIHKTGGVAYETEHVAFVVSQYHLRHTFGSSVYRFKDVAVIIDNRDKLSETKF